MKRIRRFFIYSLVGLFSFMFFLYLSFPYNILKEGLSAQISNATQLNLTVGELKSRFPLGLKAEKITIYNPMGGKQFTFNELSVRLSFLGLLIGNLTADLEIVDESNGRIELSGSISLFDILKIGKESILPKRIDFNAKDFLFGDIVNFLLSAKANNEGTNALLKPLLEKIEIKGKLNSKVSLNLNSDDVSQSKGETSFDVKGATIDFDKGLQLPNQVFDSALFKAVSNSGQIAIDQSSLFKSQDLELAIHGKIIQKQKFDKSQMDVDMLLSMRGAFKEQIGFILDTIFNRSNSEGMFKIKISGQLSSPQVDFL